MDGEFRADVERDTFDPKKHFLRVITQQGRPQLAADANEQTDIILHYLQSLARDLIGPFGGPDGGFRIDNYTKDNEQFNFTIWPGHYYVDGILCENEGLSSPIQPYRYLNQPFYKPPLKESANSIMDDLTSTSGLLVYLDAWERHISYIQDPRIREVALGGSDTAARSQIIWQVKVTPLPPNGVSSPSRLDCSWVKQNWNIIQNTLRNLNRGLLRARAKIITPTLSSDPCSTELEARFRGEENQLYRVEIHDPGQNGTATFKWSRDNGPIDIPITSNPTVSEDPPYQIATICLDFSGISRPSCLTDGTWVEVLDDTIILQNQANPLWQVYTVDYPAKTVTLRREKRPNISPLVIDPSGHPILRCWDHRVTNVIQVQESSDDDKGWIDLEDGIQIQFRPGRTTNSTYNSGDYWLIPARTSTQDIEGYRSGTTLIARPPHGIAHHFAPLALMRNTSSTTSLNIVIDDCRCKWVSLCLSFRITIDPIGIHYVGDKFKITGATNLAEGDQILMTVVSSSFQPTEKTQTGEFAGSSGTVNVQKGETYNTFSYDIDSATFKPDEYIVKADAVEYSANTTATFIINEQRTLLSVALNKTTANIPPGASDQLRVTGSADYPKPENIAIWIFTPNQEQKYDIKREIAPVRFGIIDIPFTIDDSSGEGEGFVIPQHPGWNYIFDVNPSIGKLSKYPEPWNALMDEFDNPNNDDSYVKLAFIVKKAQLATISPDMTISPIMTIAAKKLSSTVEMDKSRVTRPSQGTVSLSIRGKAEGKPKEVAVWIFGPERSKPRGSYSPVSRGVQAVRANSNYEYMIEISKDNVKGKYRVVVQHPGVNKIFDVNPDISVLLKISKPLEYLLELLRQTESDDTFQQLQFEVK